MASGGLTGALHGLSWAPWILAAESDGKSLPKRQPIEPTFGGQSRPWLRWDLYYHSDGSQNEAAPYATNGLLVACIMQGTATQMQ